MLKKKSLFNQNVYELNTAILTSSLKEVHDCMDELVFKTKDDTLCPGAYLIYNSSGERKILRWSRHSILTQEEINNLYPFFEKQRKYLNHIEGIFQRLLALSS